MALVALLLLRLRLPAPAPADAPVASPPAEASKLCCCCWCCCCRSDPEDWERRLRLLLLLLPPVMLLLAVLVGGWDGWAGRGRGLSTCACRRAHRAAGVSCAVEQGRRAALCACLMSMQAGCTDKVSCDCCWLQGWPRVATCFHSPPAAGCFRAPSGKCPSPPWPPAHGSRDGQATIWWSNAQQQPAATWVTSVRVCTGLHEPLRRPLGKAIPPLRQAAQAHPRRSGWRRTLGRGARAGVAACLNLYQSPACKAPRLVRQRPLDRKRRGRKGLRALCAAHRKPPEAFPLP